MELDLTQWVIVTSQHGEKYVGMFPGGGVETGAEYFDRHVKDGTPVRVLNARLMLCQYGAGPTGLSSGIQAIVAFIPIDLAEGPLEELNVVPSSWYFPPTTPAVIDKFKRLLTAAEEAEENNRARQSAQRAGISLPGDGRGPVER
jgi:hypothetical protein